MTAQKQQMRGFFDPSPTRRHPHIPPKPADIEGEVRVMLARNNKACPLNRIIVGEANEDNFRKIHLMCFSILQKWNRNPRGNNFGLYCPPGQGKTFIYKRIAETLGICSVFVQSASIDSNYTLFEVICDAAKKYGTPIVPYKDKPSRGDYLLPPMFVFFDEAHKLPMSMMKGGLLNAMEPDDGIMQVKMPGQKGQTFSVDCWNVCWVAATTDRGDLFDAFESRITNPIQWAPATEKELPLMIKQGLDAKVDNDELSLRVPMEACEIIARYQKVPRLAIHGFGTKVVQQKQYSPSDSWEEACAAVAKMNGIDEFGLTKRQIILLTNLGQRPVAEGRLGAICGCRAKEVTKYELPGLQQYYDGGPFVVSVSGKGMCITKSGLEELDKRGIAHNGDRVTAEYIEERR
jgi:Holliday junction resolvasome RuvABC ATP-dependent DNA helicase subunit